jgi:TetR/AcrR family transcriptional repressor of nem operon
MVYYNGLMPRDGTATRTRLLDTAERLVEQNGFAATSVDQIIESSASSKGAFFHHFTSKRALARALVARYVDADLRLLQRGLDAAASEPDPLQRPLAFLRYYERWADELVSEDSACLYIAVVAERDLLDDETAEEVRRAIRAWREGFAGLLRPALEASGASVAAEDLGDHLFATFEGAYLMCRSEHSAEPMRRQLRVLRQLVEALVAPALNPAAAASVG